jgi:hypothetical protein
MLQSLYGPRRSYQPALCPNSSFDAIFEYPAGVIYVLKGELNTIDFTKLGYHSSIAEDLILLRCDAGCVVPSVLITL